MKIFDESKLPLDRLYHINKDKATRGDFHFFSTILQTMEALVIVLDLEGKIILMNRACEEISGYSVEEVKGKFLGDALLLEEEKESVTQAIQGLRHTVGRQKHINHWLTKSGEKRLISWTNHIFEAEKGDDPYVIGTGIEITDYQSVQDELRQTQQDLKDTLHQHQGLIFKFKKIGKDFIHTLCDGEMLNIFHTDPQKVLGKSLEEILPPHQVNHIKPYFERAWAGESPVYYEASFPSGLTLLACLRPIIRDEQVVEVIGSAVDISDRKRIEQAFRESEARFRLIAENTTDLIAIVDEQGRALYASPSHEMVLGYPPSDLEGTLRLDLFHPDDVERIQEAIQVIRRTKQPSEIEYRIRHGIHPQWVDIETRGMPVMDETGEVKSIVIIARDVTKRRQQERELKETKDQLKNIFDNLEEVFYSFDTETNRFIQVSSSCEAMLGIPHSELMEQGRSALAKVLSPADMKQLGQYRSELAQGKPAMVELRVNHPQVGEKWIKGRAIPVMREGRLVRVDGIVSDMTEQRKTEELLRKWERISAIGEMAAGIAHEIRNPLTTLKGFLQLLQKETDNPMYFDLMRSELDRIEMVTNEFLMLAKPQAIQHKSIDMASLLQGVVTLFNTQAIMKNIHIDLQGRAPLPKVQGDANQIKQVFINILKNAVEAMPQGGTIQVIYCQDGDKVRVDVMDEGGGIPQELIPRLGEPFYTLKERGTGLGLMISYKIMKEHHGSLKISSEDGMGTTVSVFFPFYREALKYVPKG